MTRDISIFNAHARMAELKLKLSDRREATMLNDDVVTVGKINRMLNMVYGSGEYVLRDGAYSYFWGGKNPAAYNILSMDFTTFRSFRTVGAAMTSIFYDIEDAKLFGPVVR